MLHNTVLDRLVERGEFCIFGQHLGNMGGSPVFSPAAVQALRQVQPYQDAGKILVASTDRLLDFFVARSRLQYRWKVGPDAAELFIDRIDDPVGSNGTLSIERLQGISFRAPPKSMAPNLSIKIIVGGMEVSADRVFRADQPDGCYFGLHWLPHNTEDPTGLVTVLCRLSLYYATFASNAKGLMPPRYEWRRRVL
jgi:hypothetical protein